MCTPKVLDDNLSKDLSNLPFGVPLVLQVRCAWCSSWLLGRGGRRARGKQQWGGWEACPGHIEVRGGRACAESPSAAGAAAVLLIRGTGKAAAGMLGVSTTGHREGRRQVMLERALKH